MLPFVPNEQKILRTYSLLNFKFLALVTLFIVWIRVELLIPFFLVLIY